MDWNWLQLPREQVFLKKEWQEEFNEKGYIILDGLSKEDLQETKKATYQLLGDIKKKAPKRYFPVGQLMDFDLRNRSTMIIDSILPEILKRHFDIHKIDFYSGTHLIKPRGRRSFLSTHQDSALVDETKYHSILLWCPLQHTNFINGRLFVLEGSHRLGNIHRSTTIPWAFKAAEPVIYQHSKPVSVKAGQVCYFHSGLIHHSGYNWVQPYRIALSSLITSKGAPLINCYQDDDTPKGKVEIYEADMEFFHNHDFNKRPEGYQQVGIVDQRFPAISNSELASLISSRKKPA